MLCSQRCIVYSWARSTGNKSILFELFKLLNSEYSLTRSANTVVHSFLEDNLPEDHGYQKLELHTTNGIGGGFQPIVGSLVQTIENYGPDQSRFTIVFVCES